MNKLVLESSLATYASPEEHIAHSDYGKTIWQFHHATATAMKERLAGNVAFAAQWESDADKYAQKLEKLERDNRQSKEAWAAQDFLALLRRHQVCVQRLSLENNGSELKIVIARSFSQAGYRGTGQDRALGKAFEIALDELATLEARDREEG